MNPEIINEPTQRERECIHRVSGAEGNFYGGLDYISHLQSLRGDKAIIFASRVSPFFWADAKDTRVWLCNSCAKDVGLKDTA